MDSGGAARNIHFPDNEFQESRAVSLNSPHLRDLFDYWTARVTRQHLPSRKQLDPIDIPHLLSTIARIDVEETPRRYRYRLVGTRLVDWFKRDFTGLYLGETGAVGQDDEILRRCYSDVVEQRAPMVEINCRPHLDRPYRNYERLILPLEDHQSKRVNMLLVGMALHA